MAPHRDEIVYGVPVYPAVCASLDSGAGAGSFTAPFLTGAAFLTGTLFFTAETPAFFRAAFFASACSSAALASA